ncbi:MAG: class I SAM-dependent methyltransferase [Vicinamibacterales bacterium]
MTYQPDLYDVVTPATLQGDVDWYCREAQRSGGPVLELGAGTGRVTLSLWQRPACRFYALDSDTRMLARLQSKLASTSVDVQGRITVVAADMRSFDLV